MCQSYQGNMGYPLGNPPNVKEKKQGLLHTSATIFFWVRFAKHEGAIRPHDKNKNH